MDRVTKRDLDFYRKLLRELRLRFPGIHRVVVNKKVSLKQTLVEWKTKGWITKLYEDFADEKFLHFVSNSLTKDPRSRLKTPVILDTSSLENQHYISDTFLQLISTMTSSDKSTEIGNLFIDFLRGKISELRMVLEIFNANPIKNLDQREKLIETASDVLNQIEILIYFFDQKILSIHIYFIQSVLNYLSGHQHLANDSLKTALEFKSWFEGNYPELDFSVLNSEINRISTITEQFSKVLTEDIELTCRKSIVNVVADDILSYISINSFMFESNHQVKKDLTFIMIYDSITLYSKTSKRYANKEIPTLVGSFISALFALVSEIDENEDRIDTITLFKGAIYLFKSQKFIFVLYTNFQDLRDKIALKRLGLSLVNELKGSDEITYGVSSQVQNLITKTLIKYFPSFNGFKQS